MEILQEIPSVRDLQNPVPNDLYHVLSDYVPNVTIIKKNAVKSWEYGYDEKHDMVVISKTGQIGEIVSINGLVIALPLQPSSKEIICRNQGKKEQYWERKELPKELKKISNIFEWNKMPQGFKDQWVDYIENEFDRRDNGVFFMNQGVVTYLPPSHYMYLQWSSIDVGYPDFREANRILFLFWEACIADNRSFGMCYLKIRRSGFSYMESSEGVNFGTLARNSRVGVLSKTGADAKKMFTDKVVPILNSYPFFFKPIQDGMDKPKTEISFRVPASKITKKNMSQSNNTEIDGLDTTIDWRNTDDNSYDGEKIQRLLHDESAKWLVPNNIINNWAVTKTCLRIGNKIIGKCMMGSTANALKKGGGNYKNIYEDSHISTRNKNGRTKSGLYALFIPMEVNTEGFIDRYGFPVLRKPDSPIMGVDGNEITNGVIDYWEAEVDSLKDDSAGLNEFYRQNPRTESHAFRDESAQSLFNLTKIYQQIDYNDGMIAEHYLTRGNFAWKDGIIDTKVEWRPHKDGRFLISRLPEGRLQNAFYEKMGIKYPKNEHVGAFGCDPYDISGVVGGGGSKGALSGLTKFHMEEGMPTNQFFLEYIARPQTAEIFFEDVLMAIVFCGMPVLVENQKPRLLYHIKNRGYRGFAMNRPDKHFNQLSQTERELGGIPSSTDVIQSHASAIESYIEKFVGIDFEGKFREKDEMGIMPFNRTLNDWSKFDICNRTFFDASVSSGFAVMANQKTAYLPEIKRTGIKINFSSYDNSGVMSTLIRN
jgi:hypothetical protein